jgi:hypothetical protein
LEADQILAVPPLGLATLAAYCNEEDDISLQDEHVEELDINDEPELVVIQVYITNAFRAYKLADHYRRKGAYVCLGGLHVTSLPMRQCRMLTAFFSVLGKNAGQIFERPEGRTCTKGLFFR